MFSESTDTLLRQILLFRFLTLCRRDEILPISPPWLIFWRAPAKSCCHKHVYVCVLFLYLSTSNKVTGNAATAYSLLSIYFFFFCYHSKRFYWCGYVEKSSTQGNALIKVHLHLLCDYLLLVSLDSITSPRYTKLSLHQTESNTTQVKSSKCVMMEDSVIFWPYVAFDASYILISLHFLLSICFVK